MAASPVALTKGSTANELSLPAVPTGDTSRKRPHAPSATIASATTVPTISPFLCRRANSTAIVVSELPLSVVVGPPADDAGSAGVTAV